MAGNGRIQLTGQSPAFQQCLALIRKCAQCHATVLIQGETGTGKELAARAVHYLGPRSDHAFIPVNCGALPDTLLESELFGHERGAFTDARSARRGLVAQAEGGTLFLDEVEAMSPRAQVVLLRFLQDREYRPVGGQVISGARVRVVASSNADLLAMVERGAFRADLLFRLSVLEIAVPPLRERVGDAALLARSFVARFSEEYERPGKCLHPQTLRWIDSYDWPGNVRELENLMLREFLLGEGDDIRVAPPRHAGASGSLAQHSLEAGEAFEEARARALAQFERDYLSRLLLRTGGNISLAARVSRKDRSSLNKLVRKHGLSAAQFR